MPHYLQSRTNQAGDQAEAQSRAAPLNKVGAWVGSLQLSAYSTSASTMEILESWESFKNIDGKLKFHHMSAVLQLTDSYFLIEWPDRFSRPTDLSSACSVQKLDTHRGPEIKPTWTLVSQSASYYLKTPTLSDYASQGLEARMLREIERFFGNILIPILQPITAVITNPEKLQASTSSSIKPLYQMKSTLNT